MTTAEFELRSYGSEQTYSMEKRFGIPIVWE